MPRRKCHYDVLGVSRTVDQDQLKKVYRQLALKFHPDKNREASQEEAKEIFQEIQQAYEVLSDPQERAWYDAHREAILQGGGIAGDGEVDVGGIDLFPFFSSSCYKGFSDDSEEGFYKVYEKLFKTLCEEDQVYSDEVLRYPEFGNSQTPDEDWQEFYAFFSAYVTPRSYAWLDKYDTRQAENRRVSRLMEKENKKIRDVARKERNDLVRELVKFVRKRDKRIQEFNKKLEAKAAENARKTEEMRKKHLEERARLLQEVEESGTFGMGEMEAELQNLEAAYDSSEGEESNYCVACNKQLRNEKAFASHLKQKKHLENVKLLKEVMAEEDLDLKEYGLDHKEEEENSDSDIEKSEALPADVNTDEEEMEIEEPVSKSKKKAKKKSKARQVQEPIESDEEETIEEPKLEDIQNLDKTDESEVPKPKLSKAKLKKAKRAAKGQTVEVKEPELDKEDVDTVLSCAVCAGVFDSKNKLFAHLKSSGHAIFVPKDNQSDKGKKKKKTKS